MTNSGMTILVTGGAGFVGSNVVRKLIEAGDTVIVYDNFTQYFSPLESEYQKNLALRFDDIKDSIIWVRADTRDKNDLHDVVAHYKPSHIIHLAAMPLADLSYHRPEEALGSILMGTFNALQAAHQVGGVSRFVYISSSMVYGDFQRTSADEEHPKKPMDLYGGMKYAGEILVESFSRRMGIEYTIVRPSAVYGPTDINRRVSQLFVEKALRGEQLELRGDVMLDFSYVNDTANGIVLAAKHQNGANQAFNITYGHGRTLREYVEILQTLIPNIQVVEAPAEMHRPKRGSLDISKARNLLGYAPEYSLEVGLPLYVEFIRKGMV
ncbi:MAG: NAD-dependent epimerase/dehydratase family protein [Deltaproteobacteria bacterium]|nr:NAD-dependent epimerase/dehydratase family protein [Deltaproteobacteria bacterium]